MAEAREYPAQRHDQRDPEAILRYVVSVYVEPKSYKPCACRPVTGDRCMAHVDAENARWAVDQLFPQGEL